MTDSRSDCCPTCGFPHGFFAELLAPILARALQEALTGKMHLEMPSAQGDAHPNAGAEIQPESPGGGGDSDPNTARAPSTEPAASPPAKRGRRKPGGQGEPTPAAGGVGVGNRGRASDELRESARRRLIAWLTAEGTTIDKAVRQDGVDLGASHQTLYNLLKPKGAARASTIESVLRALAVVETDSKRKAGVDPDRVGNAALFRKPKKSAKKAQLGEYDDSKVQQLATTWPDDPGLNHLPKHDPPPRCGSSA